MGNDTPNAGEAYGEGLEAYLKHLPRLLKAEQDARYKYDPQRVEQNLALYDTYDPNYLKIRGAMSDSVLGGVKNGYALPDDFAREIEQDVRGAQAARGNIYGNAPASAETIFKGKNRIDLYNRNLANAGTFLGMPSPAMPDRAPGYTAGGIATAGGIGNNAFNAAMNQPNPWAQALAGGVSGYQAGASTGSGWGAIIGTAAGAAAGYYSSRELKRNIEKVGDDPRGFGIYEFNYLGGDERYRGVMADEIEQVRPDAVKQVGPYKMVNYDAIGVEFQRL